MTHACSKLLLCNFELIIHIYATCRNEIESIQRLVDRISFELLRVMKPPETISHETSFDTYIIGREPRMKELKSLLEVGSRGVHMVGICGMWGSGKSTLASIVYDDISHKFEGCCFVKNVRAESRMHGLKMLQEKILSSVLKLEVTLKDIDHGINMMDTRLYKNNVLIVLDDVDHIDHLNMLAESKSWFGDGSRIIFTTRNQDLVNAHNAITHNVRMLDDTEAIELFSRHAFGKKEPIPGFEKVSLDMVSKFGGHPSALIRLGSFLRDKYKLNEWMYILARLEATPDAEILKKFKIRDDGVVRDISHWLLT